MRATLIRGLLASLVAAASISAQAQPVQLNLGHVLAPGSHYHFMSQRLAELAAKKSNGELTINIFPQGQLGGEVRMIQAARTGTLDLFITAQAPLVGTEPRFGVFDAPFLFSSLDQANRILNGPVGNRFLEMLPRHNLVGLGFLSAMERNVFSNRPIRKASDMAGLKIRVMQSPGYVRAYAAFGAQPIAMPYGDVYLALQQGTIDGADTSPDQFVMDKFIEVSRYYNLTRLHYLPGLLIASKTTFDRLNKRQQQILRESANEALEAARAFYLKSYAESMEQMKKAGVRVIETDVGSLKPVSAKTREALVREIPDGTKLYDMLQQAIGAL